MVRKQKIEEPTFPTQDVVASAFAAHRINKGYFREKSDIEKRKKIIEDKKKRKKEFNNWLFGGGNNNG